MPSISFVLSLSDWSLRVLFSFQTFVPVQTIMRAALILLFIGAVAVMASEEGTLFCIRDSETIRKLAVSCPGDDVANGACDANGERPLPGS